MKYCIKYSKSASISLQPRVCTDAIGWISAVDDVLSGTVAFQLLACCGRDHRMPFAEELRETPNCRLNGKPAVVVGLPGNLSGTSQ